MIKTKYKTDTNYNDLVSKLWEWDKIKDDSGRMRSRNVTFQVTDECSLACSYCYQHNKGKRYMSFETGKKLVDTLIKEDDGYYVAIIIEFIGGEPFLAIDTIKEICDYWEEQLFIRNHRWLYTYRISICSNGMHNTNPKVIDFIKKYENRLSFTITIDGDKELHDSCRRTPLGTPSYDIAHAAAKKYEEDTKIKLGSKVTIAPGNLIFLFHAIKHYIEEGAIDINANCVFEEGWTYEDAKVYYFQLKKIADYLINNDLWDTIKFSRFDRSWYIPLNPSNIQMWCGGSGKMLAMDPDGNLYPCLRFMESSLGDNREPLRCGHIDTGIDEDTLAELRTITRKSCSTEECFNCPVASGCSQCSAYDYEVFGTVNARATFICPMHKAEALANVYFWNMIAAKIGDEERFKMYLSKEKALEIIDEKEYEFLLKISEGTD